MKTPSSWSCSRRSRRARPKWQLNTWSGKPSMSRSTRKQPRGSRAPRLRSHRPAPRTGARLRTTLPDVPAPGGRGSPLTVSALGRRRPGEAGLGNDGPVARGRFVPEDPGAARRRHRHEVADPLHDPADVGPSGEGPRVELVETVPPAPPEAERTRRGAYEDGADAAGAGDPRRQLREPFFDLLERQRLGRLDAVDERGGSSRDDADAGLLAHLARASEDPGKVVLEGVHEPLEEAGAALSAIRQEAAAQPARCVLRRHRLTSPGRIEEVVEEHPPDRLAAA